MADRTGHLTPAEVRARDERHRANQIAFQDYCSWRVRSMTRTSQSEFARAVRELEKAEGYTHSVRYATP